MKPTKERTDALKNTLNKLKAQIEDKSNASKVEKLSLDKINYSSPSDDELAKSARKQAEEKFQTEAENKKQAYNDKKNSLEMTIEQMKKQAEDSDKELDNNYQSSKKEIENQSIKRGLQRSSIVMGELDNLENQKLSKKEQAGTKLNESINNLNGEIQKLTDNLNESLRKFDMEKAIEINEQLEKLSAERESKMNEVTKYNNEVTKKETEYNNSLNEKYPEALEREKEKVNDEIANEVLKYFMEYDNAKEAYEDFVNDQSLKEFLGSNYSIVKNILNGRY